MKGLILTDDLDRKVHAALSYFWSVRSQQIARQYESEHRDQGNRGAVTGGKQLDGFVNLMRDILMENGVEEGDIFTDTDLELPGYYRPNKKWDLLVVSQHKLIAAIEFKSQAGPSFGNNFNNRTEEAMGSALDLWTAYREGVFGSQIAPWLGYFMVLEDCPKSAVPVKVRSPHFDIMKEFTDASYQKRYEIFCSRLLLERQYSAACFMTTSVSQSGHVSARCPNAGLSYRSFIASMLGAVVSQTGREGPES